MFLLRLKSKHHDQVKLVRAFEEGTAEARRFVGDHNPVDGCSAPPLESGSKVGGKEKFAILRQTSFGERRATVQPISQELEELL